MLYKKILRLFLEGNYSQQFVTRLVSQKSGNIQINSNRTSSLEPELSNFNLQR